MRERLTIQSWNILHGGGRRLPEIALALLQHRADVIVLSEFRRRLGGQLAGILADHGWTAQAMSPASSSQNGVMVASRLPLEAREADPPACLRSRWCEVTLAGGMALVALHLPEDSRRDDQRRAWAYLLERARRLAGAPAVLVGDFNAGRNGIDGCGRGGGRFAASAQMGALWSLGFCDAWRALHPGEREASWEGPRGASGGSGRLRQRRAPRPSGVRIDHACVSGALRPALLEARFSQDERALGLSDHAPLLVTLGLGWGWCGGGPGGENGGESAKNADFWGQSPTRQLAGEGKSL